VQRSGHGDRRGGKSIVTAGLCVLCAANAHAELWNFDNTLSTRYEANDNASLVQASTGTMNTLTLSTAMNAGRRSENSATSLNANIAAVRHNGPGAQDRLDTTLGFAQTLEAPLDQFGLNGQYVQDFNDQPATNDVTVGRGRRRISRLNGDVSHSLSERLDLNARLGTELGDYGQAGGVDYRSNSLSGGSSYRLNEVYGFGFNAGRTDYRTRNGRNRSTTDQITFSLSATWSESSSLTVGLGRYRTRTEGVVSRTICPTAPADCLFGPQPLITVDIPTNSTGNGLQYNVSGRHRFGEKTEFSLNAAREQVPSGSGTVTRNDSVRIAATHAFSERTNLSAGYLLTRSAYQGFTLAQQPAQQTASLTLMRQLTPYLDLQGGFQHVRSEGTNSGSGAHSNAVSLSLNYRWPRFETSH
jgi:hypothetical protein